MEALLVSGGPFLKIVRVPTLFMIHVGDKITKYSVLLY